MSLKESIRKVLREEVNSHDKETTLSNLVDMMGPSNTRNGNRIEVMDDDLIKYDSKITINVDKINQETLNKINDFMDERGWFPTNIKSLNGVKGKYSHNVKNFLGEKDVVIGYESRVNGEMVPNTTTAYHVTPDIFLHDILKNGLTPKTESKLSDHPERIYLFLNSENTFKPMVNVLWDSLSDNKKKIINDYIVLEIDLEQIPNHKFYLDSQSSLTYKSIYTLQTIPKSAIKVKDKISTSDLKPMMSSDEEKLMDDERQELIKSMSVNNDINYDDLISRLGDDDATISMDDLFSLKESIRKVLREEVERKYLKPSPNSEKLIYEILNKLFSGADMYYEKVSKARHDFDFCKNGKRIIEFIMYFDNDDDAWEDKRASTERNFREGNVLIYRETIDDILKHIPIRRNYLKHIFDEWFEETYLDMIHEKMGRNDITIDTIDELTGRPDVCVPTQTKPDEITDEEMIEYIMKNTLYRREHIEKNESEEPGWIEDLYLKKLRKNKHDELRGY